MGGSFTKWKKKYGGEMVRAHAQMGWSTKERKDWEEEHGKGTRGGGRKHRSSDQVPRVEGTRDRQGGRRWWTGELISQADDEMRWSG